LLKGWNVPTNGANGLIAGRGFLAHTADQVVATSTGTLHTSDVVVNDIEDGGETNSGWHLLGNPYAAPIDVATFLSNNSGVLDQSAYLLLAQATMATRGRAM
jgi:hypothetical protein